MLFHLGHDGGLIPADDDARALTANANVGDTIDLGKRPAGRDSAFRRFVFAMLHRLAPYGPTGSALSGTKPNLRAYLAIVTGWITLVRRNGTPIIVPVSLADMNADEFEAFWADARVFITTELLPPVGEDPVADDLRASLK